LTEALYKFTFLSRCMHCNAV